VTATWNTNCSPFEGEPIYRIVGARRGSAVPPGRGDAGADHALWRASRIQAADIWNRGIELSLLACIPPEDFGLSMAVLMKDFLADQIFGLDVLVSLSNVVFLVAYSVRDVLKLRVLAIAGEFMILPYYYFQREALWPPIFWGGAFMIVNAVRIVTALLESRPVVLSDKEDELYRLAFGSLDKREFLRLVNFVRWVDCSPGEIIFKQGQEISEAIVLVSGEVEAILNGTTILALRPGQLIGDVNAYSGLASPADVMARGPGTLAKWDLRHIRELTESSPELRAKLLRIENADLATKMCDLAVTLSGVVTEKMESGPPLAV
jgi:CRP-like cAMP-binding protein